MKQFIIPFLMAALMVSQIAVASDLIMKPASFLKEEPAAITAFDYSVKNQRIYLHWTVSDNQAADRFELESSLGGAKYRMIALIFGTDSADINDYKFIVKQSRKTVNYRLKVTQKDGSVHYHPVVLEVR